MTHEPPRCLVCEEGVLDAGACCNCGATADQQPVVAGGQGREQDGEDARMFAYAVAIIAALVGVVWYFATHLPGHQP